MVKNSREYQSTRIYRRFWDAIDYQKGEFFKKRSDRCINSCIDIVFLIDMNCK